MSRARGITLLMMTLAVAIMLLDSPVHRRQRDVFRRAQRRHRSVSPIRTAGRFLKNEPDAARSSRPQSRGRDGRFKKGHSGNPGGRPKILAEVKQAARVYTEAALKTPLRASLLPAPSSIMVGGEARLVRADERA